MPNDKGDDASWARSESGPGAAPLRSPAIRAMSERPDSTPVALPAPLADATGYLLRRAFVLAYESATAAMPPGVHPRDYAILGALVAIGPTSQRQLAEHLHVNRTVMVKLLDELERRGLVERRRDPADRRANALHATAAGEAELAVMEADIERGEALLSERLSAAERGRLIALLQTLIGARERGLPPRLAARLGFLVAQAHHRSRVRADEAFGALELEARHFGALSALAAMGAVSQQQLARELGVSGPVIVEIVDALEARGLVERRRNARDRRAYELHPTAAGERTLREAQAVFAEFSRELAAPIGEEGDRELRVLLRKLLGAAAVAPPASAV